MARRVIISERGELSRVSSFGRSGGVGRSTSEDEVGVSSPFGSTPPGPGTTMGTAANTTPKGTAAARGLPPRPPVVPPLDFLSTRGGGSQSWTLTSEEKQGKSALQRSSPLMATATPERGSARSHLHPLTREEKTALALDRGSAILRYLFERRVLKKYRRAALYTPLLGPLQRRHSPVVRRGDDGARQDVARVVTNGAPEDGAAGEPHYPGSRRSLLDLCWGEEQDSRRNSRAKDQLQPVTEQGKFPSDEGVRQQTPPLRSLSGGHLSDLPHADSRRSLSATDSDGGGSLDSLDPRRVLAEADEDDLHPRSDEEDLDSLDPKKVLRGRSALRSSSQQVQVVQRSRSTGIKNGGPPPRRKEHARSSIGAGSRRGPHLRGRSTGSSSVQSSRELAGRVRNYSNFSGGSGGGERSRGSFLSVGELKFLQKRTAAGAQQKGAEEDHAISQLRIVDNCVSAIRRLKYNPFLVGTADIELLGELCIPGVVMEEE